MYLVNATLIARPERRQDLVVLLTQVVATARTEPGCLSYTFSADIEDENSFYSVETWTDRAALEVHLSSPALAEALGKVPEYLSAPPSIVGHAVDGDLVKFA